MEQKIDSDLTMADSHTFDYVLHQIISSSLNFQLQLSPFSANISLKKSFVKDKSGIPLLSNSLQYSVQDQELLTQNMQLKLELQSLNTKHEELVKECASTHATVQYLENIVKERDITIQNLDSA